MIKHFCDCCGNDLHGEQQTTKFFHLEVGTRSLSVRFDYDAFLAADLRAKVEICNRCYSEGLDKLAQALLHRRCSQSNEKVEMRE